MLYSFGKLGCKAGALDGCNGQVVTVLGAFQRELPQHHLRVVYEILVDGKAIFGLAQLHPVRLMVDGPVTFLQKDNIRYHFGACVRLERIIRQTDGTQQIGTFCHVFAGGTVLAVHGVAASDECHYAARTHLVDGLGEKVVVDAETQLVVRLIVDSVVSKGHVAHGKIIKVTPVGGLKTGYGNVSLRVQFFRNAPGDAVQFHAVQAAVLHGVRQHSKEVAHAHTRFQNVTAAESHAFHCIVDTTDHGGAGVVSVQGAGTGCGVFLLGKQSFQFGVFLCPTIFAGVKGICQTAPAHILGKYLLLLGGGTTVFLLQLEQSSDGFNVPGVLLLCTALAQMVVRDVEVPGRHGVQGFIQGSGIREGLNLSVYHGRDGQFIQFLIGELWLNLPQTVLELSFVDNFVIPRLPLCAGIDSHICFTHIADFPFDGSGRKINDNIVTDLVIGQGAFHHILFLFVQFPDKRKRFLPENRHPHFCQCNILQGHAVLIKVYRIHPESASLHVDGGTQRQIILPAQVLRLVVGAVLVQPGKIDVLAALPQLFGTVCPLVAGEAGDRDGAQFRFLFQQFAAQKFADFLGILAVKLKLSVLLKAYQRIRVLLLQGVVLGGGIQRQQRRAFFRFAVVVLQFLVCNADQFGEIQCFQLCFGQIFQTFVLPLVDQHLAQIPLHTVSNQIHINLNWNIFIGGVGVGNANLG